MGDNHSALTAAERFLLVPFYGRYLKLHYRMKTEGLASVLPIKGPAFVFANHAHTLDPFLISAVYPYHISWVAGSYLFKMKGVGYLLKHWVHSIPKTQGRSDYSTIRSISEALKRNEIVGLFPEGTRTWDGDMMDITTATAKLIRIFNVPVVFIHIKGGFPSHPRWADHERKGPIAISVKRVLTSEEIKAMDLPQITKAVQENLSFSNDKWQESAMIPYKGKRRAEGIESLFYRCPSCRTYSAIKAEGNAFRCTSCGASAELDDYDRICNSRKIPFRYLSQWHLWERNGIDALCKAEDDGKSVFPEDDGVLLMKLEGHRFKVLSKSFTVITDRKGITIPEEGLRFPFSAISSMVINAKQTLELFSSNEVYRFRLAKGRSPLKIWELYNCLHDLEEDR